MTIAPLKIRDGHVRASGFEVLNSTAIKSIACVLMFADHVHQMFSHVGAPDWLSWLGRPVFAMFLFCSAEAFRYTRDRRRYILRLGIASVLMSVADIVIGLMVPNANVVLFNNAFMTFFVAALYMLFYDILVDGIKTRNRKKIAGSVLFSLVPMAASLPMFVLETIDGEAEATGAVQYLTMGALAVPNLFFTEGGEYMVAIGVLFYILRNRRWAQVMVLVAASALTFGGEDDANQWLMSAAAVAMLMYNGEKGKGMKNFFYVFYPAHIFILYIISTALFGGDGTELPEP